MPMPMTVLGQQMEKETDDPMIVFNHLHFALREPESVVRRTSHRSTARLI